MPSPNSEPARRSKLTSARFSPLIAFVTLVALLLIARVEVRAQEWHYDYPLLSLRDPTRALFLYAEQERRVVQSGLVPRWLDVTCAACDAPSVAKRWSELSEEYLRYHREGYRRRDESARWVKAASAISLAGWGKREDIQTAIELFNNGTLPDYLSARAEGFARDDAELERKRVVRAGRSRLIEISIRIAFILFALAAAVGWKFRFGGLRPFGRAALAAPSLGRGLVIFVWAEGFVAVLHRLYWANPGSPLEIFRVLPSLALTIAVSALLLGTRSKPSDRPIGRLLRCPTDPRRLRHFWVGALASVGVIYGFDWLHSGMLSRIGILPNWSDGVRETVMYGSLGRALLSQFSAIVLAPFAEELTFRGVLFGSLATRMSPHRAALISSIVFAATHGYGWAGFTTVALAGYLWARLAERFGSLVPGMLAHGTLNLIIGIFRFAARA